LIKDGWTVTHDPYKLKAEGTTYEVDMGAEKLFAAQKDKQKILVEVKSLLRLSIAHEFHAVLGTFVGYQINLEELNSDRVLYIAIPNPAYKRIQQIPILLKYINRVDMKLIIFDKNKKEILEWIK